MLQVKHCLTFNEPYGFTWLGYGEGTHAPGIQQPNTYPYMAAHNVIKSYAAAWHAYDNDFRPIQNGYFFLDIFYSIGSSCSNLFTKHTSTIRS